MAHLHVTGTLPGWVMCEGGWYGGGYSLLYGSLKVCCLGASWMNRDEAVNRFSPLWLAASFF